MSASAPATVREPCRSRLRVCDAANVCTRGRGGREVAEQRTRAGAPGLSGRRNQQRGWLDLGCLAGSVGSASDSWFRLGSRSGS